MCCILKTADRPPIGAFLRPVGHFGFCLKVLKVAKYDDGEQIIFQRWGLSADKQPFNDGHKSLCYHDELVRVAANVWKDPACEWFDSTYYVLIKKEVRKGENLEMFD